MRGKEPLARGKPGACREAGNAGKARLVKSSHWAKNALVRNSGRAVGQPGGSVWRGARSDGKLRTLAGGDLDRVRGARDRSRIRRGNGLSSWSRQNRRKIANAICERRVRRQL